MSRKHIILAQAIEALRENAPRIGHTLAQAGAGDHDETLQYLRDAQIYARDLLTRIEIAELELAADKQEEEEAA
jgi:hypothetical protein